MNLIHCCLKKNRYSNFIAVIPSPEQTSKRYSGSSQLTDGLLTSEQRGASRPRRNHASMPLRFGFARYRRLGAFFINACGLALEMAEIIKLGATNMAFADAFDFSYIGRMQRENAFHADAF